MGAVLEPYDTDKQYPVLGFGAKIKDPATDKYGAVQHCFPVYGGGLEVHGIEGIQKVSVMSLVCNVLCFISARCDQVFMRLVCTM